MSPNVENQLVICPSIIRNSSGTLKLLISKKTGCTKLCKSATVLCNTTIVKMGLYFVNENGLDSIFHKRERKGNLSVLFLGFLGYCVRS